MPRVKGSILLTLLGITLGFACTANAGEHFLSWQTSNLQVLHGDGYKLAPDDRGTILTLEHSNRWRYGDFFGFVDYGLHRDAENTVYAEITPRLSLSKVTGRDWRLGAMQDIYLAGQVELLEGGARRYTRGIGTDLALPGFRFFKANILHRHNRARADSTWQVYVAWQAQFSVNNVPLIFEGFADFFGEEGGATVPSQLLVPRLLIGAGRLLQQEDHKLQVGIEWQYWHNKFGVDGITESVPQLQVKYTL